METLRHQWGQQRKRPATGKGGQATSGPGRRQEAPQSEGVEAKRKRAEKEIGHLVKGPNERSAQKKHAGWKDLRSFHVLKFCRQGPLRGMPLLRLEASSAGNDSDVGETQVGGEAVTVWR